MCRKNRDFIHFQGEIQTLQYKKAQSLTTHIPPSLLRERRGDFYCLCALLFPDPSFPPSFSHARRRRRGFYMQGMLIRSKVADRAAVGGRVEAAGCFSRLEKALLVFYHGNGAAKHCHTFSVYYLRCRPEVDMRRKCLCLLRGFYPVGKHLQPENVSERFFVFLPGKNRDKAMLGACTGWVRHMGRFDESRRYTFALDAKLTKGEVEVLLLDQQKQPLLKLSKQSPFQTIELDGKNCRYYLRWEFKHASGQCELCWR